MSLGASYKLSEKTIFDFGYSHIFFDAAPFCVANPALNGGTSQCDPSNPGATALKGSADGAADLLSVGVRYKF